ncbi:MAG: hypothetical protein JXK05_04670 [Campylobacterales bacterium]|nr:hypothetical protein [Campylobacterales bacterium]
MKPSHLLILPLCLCVLHAAPARDAYVTIAAAYEYSSDQDPGIAAATRVGSVVYKTPYMYAALEAEATRSIVPTTDSGDDLDVDVTASSFGLYAAAMTHVTQRLYLKPRIGAVYHHYDAALSGQTKHYTVKVKEAGVGLGVGLGVGVRLSPVLDLIADVTMLDDTALIHASLGLNFRFSLY